MINYTIDLCSNELEEAKKTYDSYIQQINDNHRKFQENKEEIKVLLVTDENMKAAEAVQCGKVSNFLDYYIINRFFHKYSG